MPNFGEIIKNDLLIEKMKKFEWEKVQKVMVKVYAHHLSEKLKKDPTLASEAVNIAKTDKNS